MNTRLTLSYHAQRQASRRNFSYEDILFVVRYASRHHATGAIFYQMYAKDLPEDIPANDRRRHLIGATVLTCKCKTFVITMYKNPDAFRKDQKKKKYDSRSKEEIYCPCCDTHHFTDRIH